MMNWGGVMILWSVVHLWSVMHLGIILLKSLVINGLLWHKRFFVQILSRHNYLFSSVWMRIRIYKTAVFIRSRPVERGLFLLDNFFVLL